MISEPLITAWTVMPFRIVAKAWTDPTFQHALIASPNTVLQNALWEIPWGSNFIVTAEAGNQRYLVLPELPAAYAAWTQDQVTHQLKRETFDDISLQYYLPALVTSRAFFDGAYSGALTTPPADPNLASMGYTPQAGLTYTVLQNTGTNMNLVLPLIPPDWSGLSYSDLLQRLNAQSRQLVTGRI